MGTPSRAALALVIAACLGGGVLVAAQSAQSVSAARDLYAAAAYRDALSMLDSLRSRRPAGDEVIEIEKYRAFCLVALGRAGEAEESIARILAAQPRFRLVEDEVSRRVFAIFEDARRRVLPGVVAEIYERAKQAYDRQDLEVAKRGFTLVDALADEPSADSRVLKDLQTLARGFLTLVMAATPPIRSTPLAMPVSIAPATKDLYDGGDEGIVPPVVVEQRVPAWPAGLRPAPSATAVVEVVVNERGEVESARLAPPFDSPYDELLLAATKAWRYRPALCGRQPVKFRRRVQIVAGPPPGSEAETARPPHVGWQPKP